MAPAWFTVAMPAMIEPSTRKISASGGTSGDEHLAQNARRIRRLNRHGRRRFRADQRDDRM
jgi:hypothetical protein